MVLPNEQFSPTNVCIVSEIQWQRAIFSGSINEIVFDTVDITKDNSSERRESESENDGGNFKLYSDSIDKEISFFM